MPDELVRIDVDGFVAVVTLDNPPHNAQSLDMMTELITAFDQISDRDDIRAVVLTGKGNVFSAGADLKKRAAANEGGQADGPGDGWGRSRIAREKNYAVLECTKPVIAAVNGAALGAGLGLVAMADIIVASDQASFGLPEIDVGLAGGARAAMRLFPHSLVRRMVLTGYRLPAQEAFRRGIIEACLPVGQLLPYCLDIARCIAAKSPLAVKAAKDSLFVIEHMTLKDGYRYEQTNTAWLSRTEDAKEAIRAFMEKRSPIFLGR